MASFDSARIPPHQSPMTSSPRVLIWGPHRKRARIFRGCIRFSICLRNGFGQYNPKIQFGRSTPPIRRLSFKTDRCSYPTKFSTT
ncbi:hypothetical protein GJ744_008097 [Endocarpon pusillum]|uniref:Uncharacterized protein n=1 Tax=Endocarpon pusillum TaxID=364733 RepID=A0A8H7AL35_9EURO|nr:hypothetical protein GJ744_008097 [Endocarpon pusillum]